MRKNEPMSEDILKKRLEDRLKNGEKLSPLTKMRLSRGISQIQLAEKAGMKQAYIARIESGERDTSRLTMLNGYRLAKALGCRMEDLL